MIWPILYVAAGLASAAIFCRALNMMRESLKLEYPRSTQERFPETKSDLALLLLAFVTGYYGLPTTVVLWIIYFRRRRGMNLKRIMSVLSGEE